MKVKDLLNNIERCRKEYPDIDEWEVYTEQPDLMAPLNNVSFETYLKETDSDENEEEYMEIQKSYNRIKQLEREGWCFKYDSEGWVYRDVAGENTLFTKDKIFTINNNY